MQTNSHFEKANFRALIAEDGLGDIDKRLNVIDVSYGSLEKKGL